MSTVELNLPVAIAPAALDSPGKTVGQVVDRIGRHLRAADLEPEWVVVANFVDDAHESVRGLKADAPWPEPGDLHNRRRLCVSVSTGHCEGWLVQIDHVELQKVGDGGHWTSVPLVRIKTLTRSHAWSVAAAASRMLDID